MTSVVLDTGALIGFERNDRRVVAIVVQALQYSDPLLVPAGVVAQAWRNGRLQARLARLLGAPLCDVVALNDHRARAAGQLCGMAGTSDVVDASVVVAARETGSTVITSDPDDIRRLDTRLNVITI